MYALWWLDPFRIRRLPALAGSWPVWPRWRIFLCVARAAWRGYYDDGYLSKFSCSGVTAVSDFVNYGFMESDAVAAGRLKVPLEESCAPAGRRPHIIMIHDRVEFRHSAGPGHQGSRGLWQSFQIVRRQVAHLHGREQRRGELVHRIQCAGRALVALVRPVFLLRDPHRAGRVERGLPLALRRCGYSTTSLYPAHGAFMSARQFHTTTGIQTLPRRARSRRQGHRARPLLLRQGDEPAVAGSAGEAAIHLRLSRRQSLPLGEAVSSRPDAVLVRARQRAESR